jgi:esterase/lipase
VRKGIKPFQDSEPEHPDFEYRNMPVQALMELRKVAGLLEQRLPDVTCPVMIVHGSGDPMVDPASARIIDERLGSADKSLHIIQSDRHGVLHDNADGVQNLIISRLTEFVLPQVEAMPAPMRLVPRVGAISALLSIFRRRRAGADHRQ